MKPDTYAVLEFQGFVSSTPLFDKKARALTFAARGLFAPSLLFFAKGEKAYALKDSITKGTMVSLQATPQPRIEEVGGEKCRVLSWNVVRYSVLAKEKTDIGFFGDCRILDGLMPADWEYNDVGYVDEMSSNLEEFLSKASEDNKPEKKRRKGE